MSEDYSNTTRIITEGVAKVQQYRELAEKLTSKGAENLAARCEKYADAYLRRLRETVAIRGKIDGKEAIKFFTSRDEAIDYMLDGDFDQLEPKAFIPYAEQIPASVQEQCMSPTHTKH